MSAVPSLRTFLVVLLVVGCALAGIGGWLTLSNWRALSWPTVEGRVTDSGVRRRGFDYRAAVTYEYAVHSQFYLSSRISRNWGVRIYDLEREAARVVADFPVGRIVMVHYDPDDPADSFLLEELSFGNLLLLAMGIAFIGMPLALLVEISETPKSRSAPGRQPRR